MTTPEALARRVIDAQLEAAGWLVQDRAAMNRAASRRVPVREFPLATGPCDYLLLVAGKACGVIGAPSAWRRMGHPPRRAPPSSPASSPTAPRAGERSRGTGGSGTRSPCARDLRLAATA